MSAEPPVRALFLCTGNSARSILGEYLLRHLAGHRFTAASAGSHPTGTVHPLAREVLREDYGIDAGDAASQGISELEGETFDLVITVCDNAKESCPIFPGAKALVHWGLPDPAAATGSGAERRKAFAEAAEALHRALKALVSLPVESMEPHRLQDRLQRLAPPRTASAKTPSQGAP